MFIDFNLLKMNSNVALCFLNFELFKEFIPNFVCFPTFLDSFFDRNLRIVQEIKMFISKSKIVARLVAGDPTIPAGHVSSANAVLVTDLAAAAELDGSR